MKRVALHMRSLWPRRTLLPVFPFVAYIVYMAASGGLRWDHALFLFVMATLAYSTPRTKRLFIGLYPIAFVGMLYDAMRPFKNVGLTVQRVHLCDLRNLELQWFGFVHDGVRITPSDWFQTHSHIVLDVISAVPYGMFILSCIFFAVFLFIRDLEAMQVFGWCFLLLNLAGLATHHAFPCAPPWYFHANGCVVDLGAKASEGPNLARVDGLLHIDFFGGMYRRSSDIFGAVPSLHVGYPMLIVLVGWPLLTNVGRALAVGFWALMCFAAIYLDHHWVFDIVVGNLYAVIAVVVVSTTHQRFIVKANTASPGPSA